jgi:aminoglycoside phosphotransferase (APT) family kinase protein
VSHGVASRAAKVNGRMRPNVPQHAEDILKRLRELGIVAEGTPVQRQMAGTINTVVRATQPNGVTVYLRIGPPATEIEDTPSWMRPDALACEVLVLDWIRETLSCVPVTVAAGFRCLGHHWLMQEPAAGQPLDSVLPQLSSDDIRDVWRQLGVLVARLHGIGGPWFGTPTGGQQFATWAEMVRADAVGLLDDARRFTLDPEPYRQLLTEIDQHRDILHMVDRATVVHSDLGTRHVFVELQDARWVITGLIDWEYARYADPLSEGFVVDLLSRPLDDPQRGAFLSGYGFDEAMANQPSHQARQMIYRRIIAGWATTDAARLAQDGSGAPG